MRVGTFSAWGASDGGWLGNLRGVVIGETLHVLTSEVRLYRRYRIVGWKRENEPILARLRGHQ